MVFKLNIKRDDQLGYKWVERLIGKPYRKPQNFKKPPSQHHQQKLAEFPAENVRIKTNAGF